MVGSGLKAPDRLIGMNHLARGAGRRGDTTDTFFPGIGAYEGDYRNCSLRWNVLVTSTNTGYYHASAGFIVTCR